MSWKWGKLSKRIRKERGSRCQECGVLEDSSRPQGLLHCHHLLRWKSHPWLRYDEFYIIVLCQKCHEKYEAIARVIHFLFPSQGERHGVVADTRTTSDIRVNL